LIGINTAIYSPSGANAGIGFAVPVDTVNAIVPQLLKDGKLTRPGLGINILTDQVAAAQRIEGVVIMGVSPGGPADKAGITGAQQGQGGMVLGDVITKFNTIEIKRSSDLFRALDAHKPGQEVELELTRDGEKRKVKVTLEALE
jgi:S1-C subfamily serine protease